MALLKGLLTAGKVVGDAIKKAYDEGTKKTSSSSTTSGYQAKGNYNDSEMSASDTQRVNELKQAYTIAQQKGDIAGMEDAHNKAEAIRSAYGYSGGEDGSEYYQLYGGNKDTSHSNEVYNAYVKPKFDRINDDIKTANEALVKQGVDRIEAQRDNLTKAYEDQAQQNYIAYMQSKKKLPQQMATQGINGGMTESSQIALDTNYQTNNNNINVARQNAMQELDNAIIDLKNSGDSRVAEQILNNNNNALNTFLNFYDKGTANNQWQKEFNANQDQIAYENRINEENTAYSKVLNALQMGKVLTKEEADILGIDLETANAQSAYYRALQKSQLRSGSGSGSSVVKEPTRTPLTYSELNNTIRKKLTDTGLIDDEGEWKDISGLDAEKVSNGFQNVANYLLDQADTVEDLVSIAVMNNIPIERIAKAMANKGYDDDKIIATAESYIGDFLSPEYEEALLKFAHG